MIRNRYRCSLAAAQQFGRRNPVRASQGHQPLLFGRRLCMPIGFLFALLGFCHPSGSQNNIYNPNNLSTAKIIQAMKTPHNDLVIVSAHRGLHAKFGDSSTVSGIPENSLASVEAAAKAGLELLEVDVKLTSDGIPICSHDVTWGRETNPYTAGGNVFDPFTSPSTPTQIALNPRIDSLTAAQTQAGYNLRDSVSFIPQYGPSGSAPPTLQNIIDLIYRDQIASVVAIDVKDVPSFQAAWAVVKLNQSAPYCVSIAQEAHALKTRQTIRVCIRQTSLR